MISINKKEDCCGCTSCASICPQKCIVMKEDEEGFRYPIVDASLCISCGACDKACPIHNVTPEKTVSQRAFLVQHKDERIRLDSSSGGAFTAIASEIINRGGVVFGATYDDDFQVFHRYVEKSEDLRLFRNSKYVQSDLRECFREVKSFLKNDRWVCFSGTPCQIEGLVKYLGRTYEQLLLVDVVCHGIPSPLIWKKYLEYKEINSCKPDTIRFRDKYYGYKYSTMSLVKDGRNIYHAGAQLDPMLRAFFSDICDRPACYDCHFKKRYRVSDMTIWDCFSVYDFDKSMDDDKGTTRVLCHTIKGNEIINAISDQVAYREVAPDKLVYGVKEMFESVQCNPKRKNFFEDAALLNGRDLFLRYFPVTGRVVLKTKIRKLLLVTGLYKVMKKTLNKIKGR